jgi:hypothetical protein
MVSHYIPKCAIQMKRANASEGGLAPALPLLVTRHSGVVKWNHELPVSYKCLAHKKN